jgi:hypothetical protein
MAFPDPQALYRQLGQLLASMPDFRSPEPVSSDIRRWLGQAYALVDATGDLIDSARLRQLSQWVEDGELIVAEIAGEIEMIVYRALAVAELRAPAPDRGAFIPAGGVFDAFATFGKIVGEAKKDILIVDPYLDEKVLTDFASLIQPGIQMKLLADSQGIKPTLGPAAIRWKEQYGTSRPIEVRLSAPKTLHDRLIVLDGRLVWLMTQSFNAIAARSPASIVRVDGDAGTLKISAYDELWTKAAVQP